MTRKDYILLSDTLRAHFAPKIKPGADFADIEYENAKDISLAIGLALKKDNTTFDMNLWMKGCGL